MDVRQTLDVRGAKCPLPLIKSRQALTALSPGEVLKVITTDRGSVADFQGWAKTANHIELIEQETVQEADATCYVHYLRRRV